MEPKRSNMSEDDINKLVAQSMTDALGSDEVNRNMEMGMEMEMTMKPELMGRCGRTAHILPHGDCYVLRFALAFCLCVLVLRFGAAFCFCVLLIEDLLAFCLGETLPISIFGCVLSKAWTAFCFKTSCVLSQTSGVLPSNFLRFGGTHNRAGNANEGQGKPIKCYNCNGIGHIAWNYTQSKRPQNSDYFKDKMLLMHKPRERAVLG
ncbi:hypothetical protein Tco_0407103 [Tanacetum coccineum]